MADNDIRNEDLNNVTGAGTPYGEDNLQIKCPNCKSFNYVPVLSERVMAFNKVTFVCADCKHKWESLIPLFDNAQ